MRRRIVLLVVGMTALVVVAFSVPLAVLIRHNVYNDAVRTLGEEANTIAVYLHSEQTDRTPAQIAAYLKTLRDDRRASVQIISAELRARVVGTLPPGGATGLPRVPQQGHDGGGPDGGGPGGPDEHTIGYRSGKLAQLQVPSPGGAYTIRVYASDDQLHSGETGWWLLLVGASVGLLLIGVLAAELLTRRIVRPLVDTAATARALSIGDTTARAPTDGPREIGEVGAALNRLADRIDELIAEERETVANLSHRLRTPLTALRLDAEALHDPADAERVGTHVTTLERMLTSVIHAARRPQREGRLPSCDATAVVAERVAFWSALTEEQQRHGTVALPGKPVLVRASAEDLAAAVDALLENVVAHTPEGSAFAVTLAATDGGGRLVVSDDGPGLPPDEPVRGRSDRGSSGLGLDIARRCAAATGGTMTLGASASGGAEITLELRAP
jgi:signal transduction histidine kinase